MLDLMAPGGNPSEADIQRLQAMKTGALILFACEAGAILADAGPVQRQALRDYGTALGLAFQLADDLLDVNGDAAVVGKAVAKDADAGKATLVGLIGEEPQESGRCVRDARSVAWRHSGTAQTVAPPLICGEPKQ